MELICVEILVSLRHFIICFLLYSVNFKLYFLIDLDFSSNSRIFHSYRDVIIAGKICSLATHGHWTMVILKRGSENRTERKTEWNGKWPKRFEGKQNKWILLMQLLTEEYDLKQSKTLLFNKILNQQYISIFGPH